MKHLKLFFALFAMLALGVGNVWAQTVTWEKATSIAADDVVALVCESKKMELSGISTTSTKYGTGVAYSSTPAGAYELTVEAGNSSETFSFKTSDGKYLYWSSGNSLTTNATKSANTSWKVTISNGNATILNAKDNARKLVWNASSPRFACYTSNQTAVQLYKKVISEESEDVIVKTLESIAVSGMTTDYETGDVFKFDGTCTATYSVTKNGEPQDDETAVVTPTTVSTPDMQTAGTKEITVTYTEGGVTVTDKYEINITENVVTPGTYTGNLNNVFFGCATGNNAVEQSGKFDDVLVVAGCTSSASDKTNYQSGHVRFYKDSYLQLSVPAGYVIKSIVFTADGTWNGSITASAGTYTDGNKTWAGNAQEVKFSFAAQNRIKSVKVTYDVDVKYALNITTPSNGTLVVKEGSTVLTDGALVYEGTKLVVTPTPNAGYVFESLTVDGTPVDLTEGSYNLTMPAANVTIAATFKANEKPAATLTLSKNGETEDITGYKQDDKVTLPSITSDCVKEFVGWSADENCTTEPEYEAGDEYTLAETAQTLYAVYATVGGGGNATATNTIADNGWTNEKQYKSLQIDANVKVEITGTSLSNSGKFYTNGNNWRLYQNESPKLTISTTAGELKSVKFTFTNSNTGTLLYNSTALTSGTAVEVTGTSATFSIGNSGSATNGQIRITKIEVVYTGGVTYSNYSTTCAAALANPTFSLAEGKYTEAKSVEIEYTEGTVYYTMDGTEPTASSTQYTAAIALNDCGEYTIKAIAISSDSQSDVVSATYTIKLPLTNSQAAPYTEAEAIAAYDGGCYDNQDVYVKGTVKAATFNSTYGNYTITLTNGFQFYRFLQAAETKFTEDIIVPGDVLIACGKLSKYQTTYQLAEGCYLVERIPYEGEKTDISNTETTAYTVDQAFALIADVSSDLTKEVYVKGLVAVAPTSNPTADGQMTYSISDNGENTGNVLKVYLGLNLNGEKFTSKNDVQQGDYVVVKGHLLDYYSTYELNEGNQLVQHLKAATITIADITMEVGETKTIAATITPAAAETAVVYTIKENTANAISLSDNTITANAIGTATITATIATAAEYMGKTVEFTVTVNPVSTKEKVVILAQHEGQWYAMMAQYVSGKTSHLDALPVTYFDGKLYNVDEEDKSLIEWERAVVDGKATFSNNGKYVKGGTSTNLTIAANQTDAYQWIWNETNKCYTTNTSGTIRTFMYNGTEFRNFAVSNAGKTTSGTTYSSLPVVTAPLYATAIEINGGDNSTVIGTNAGQTVNVIVDRSFEEGDEWYTLCVPFNMPASVIGKAYQISGLVQKTADYVEVYLAEKTTIVAGEPYLIKPTVTVDKFVVENATIVNTTGASISKSISGLSVTMQGVINGNGTTDGLYWVGNGGFLYNDVTSKLGLRTYFSITTSSGIAPRMRVVAGENQATGVDNIVAPEGQAIKVIENGQLIIIRGGEKFNVQGQKL